MRRILLVFASLALPALAAASEVGCPARVVTPSAVATFYEPSGEGACSLPTSSGEPVVAIASADYAGSEMCGRCLRVTGPEATIDVRVVDECPTCASGQLDLRGAATFDLIANPIDGIVPISWETIACDVGAETMAMQFEGSNPYYLKAQVQNHRHGIAAVEVETGPSWLAMSRTIDDHFEIVSGTAFPASVGFRITDVHGQIVETQRVGVVNDLPEDTGVQLAQCPEPESTLASVVALGAVAALLRRR
jgi:expansin (peptidoglycan-binding protein)